MSDDIENRKARLIEALHTEDIERFEAELKDSPIIIDGKEWKLRELAARVDSEESWQWFIDHSSAETRENMLMAFQHLVGWQERRDAIRRSKTNALTCGRQVWDQR